MRRKNESARPGDAETPAGEVAALLALRLMPRLGDRKVSALLALYGSAERVVALSREEFSGAAGAVAERSRRDPELERRVFQVMEDCERLSIRIVTSGSLEYPDGLVALADPPPVLFVRGPGRLERGPTVAVVGARRATPVGRRTAESVARHLSRGGVTIVSGLALGIDGAAHRGGLMGPGGTIAVLGSGPDRAHPPGNRRLFEEILDREVAVSEFPPGEPARPYHFPRRNRIIAALSHAVVVVEAARRSGALITVDHALDLGREVFAVPGSVESPASEGTHALIRDGARLVTSGNEVAEEMGWVAPHSSDGHPSGPTGRRDAEVASVLAALGRAPRSVDELAEALVLPATRVLVALTRLEMAGEAAPAEEGWRLGAPVGR